MSTKSRLAPALIAATAAATVGIGLAAAPPASALTQCGGGGPTMSFARAGGGGDGHGCGGLRGLGGGGLLERWIESFHHTKTKAQRD